MRFVGERRALAAAILAFFMIQFLLGTLMVDGEIRLMLAGLGLAYATAFVGVVAGYFWARWYAMGLAFWGMSMSVMGFLKGVDAGPLFYVLFATHAAISLGLFGEEAATFYDGRRDWRDRLKMDDNAVNRLGKAITRAGASLPYLILLGLGPKDPSQVSEILGILSLGCGALGFSALVRARTVGLVGLAAAMGLAVVQLLLSGGTVAFLSSSTPSAREALASAGPALAAAALLGTAIAPFFRPVLRHLARPY